MKEKFLKNKKIIMIVATLLIVIPFSYALLKSIAVANGNIVAATWNVTVNESGNNYMSIAASPMDIEASYTIDVTSQSQVDMIYSIVIDGLPSGVCVSIDNGEFVQETNNKVTFSNVGTIAYSDTNKTKSHTLTFKATSSSNVVNEKEVDINVIARQALQ